MIKTIDLSHPRSVAVPWPLIRTVWLSLLVWLLVALGWAVVAHQRDAMLARLPDASVDRYVADRTPVALPRPMPVMDMALLCPPSAGLGGWRQWWSAQQRRALATCLHGLASQPPADAVLEQALERYSRELQAQIDVAGRWLQAHEAQAAAERVALLEGLDALRRAQTGPLSWLVAHTPWLADAWPAAGGVRMPLGRDGVEDAAVVARMRRALAQAQAELATPWRNRPQAERLERVRTLGLLVAGRSLKVDAAAPGTQAVLVSDRQALADVLEWQRRAQAFVQQGFGLERMWLAADALLLGAALVLLVATLGGQAPWVWGMAGLGLGASHLLMLDLALSGPPGLRYLAERQFVGLSVGERWLPLLAEVPVPINGASVMLWWPWVVVALCLLLLRTVRAGSGPGLWPVRLWVQWGDHGLGRVLQALVLMGVAAGALVGVGMAAAVSELLMWLACVGVATYWARHAALASVSDGIEHRSAWGVLVAMLVALGLSYQRGDLGHALVALCVGLLFVWLFARPALRWGLTAVVAAAAATLWASLWLGEFLPPLNRLVAGLPEHGQARFMAMLDPFTVDNSDMARVRWLMDSGGTEGWGLGWVPWQGLAQTGAMTTLPLQGPSDYALAVLTATWGSAVAVGLLGMVLALWLLAAWHAARVATRSGQTVAVRWLAALGLFGAVVMVIKVLLSMGGVAGWLPLTGLPVTWLGYGPVSHFMAMLYLVCAVGLLHVRPSTAPVKGVSLHADAAQGGRLLQRTSRLMQTTAGLTVAALGATAWLVWHVPEGGRDNTHLARDRHETASQVAAWLYTPGADHAPGMRNKATDSATPALPAPACPELEPALQALQAALASPRRTTPYQLDAAALLGQEMGERSCQAWAHRLTRLRQLDLAKTLALVPAAQKRAAKAATGGLPELPQSDFTTANPWWGLPGCVSLGQTAAATADTPAPAPAPQPQSPVIGQRCTAASAQGGWQSVLDDTWLVDALAMRLPAITRSPSGQTVEVHRRAVAVGKDVHLTIDPAMQTLATAIARCYTGVWQGAACERVLPRTAHIRERHFSGRSHRSGVLGMTVLDADSGEVLAMAGAVSDCSRSALGRKATTRSTNPKLRPALLDGQWCAQVPDQQSAYLLEHSPALWTVPPGSALKPWVFAAGVDSGVIAPAQQAAWLPILAESHDQITVERTALHAQARWIAMLGHAGFEHAQPKRPWQDLLSGRTPPTGQPRVWATQAFEGWEQLKASPMDFATMERIRQEKKQGVNVDKKYGHSTISAYLDAQELTSASIGGGSLRISTLGLAQTWLLLDRRARNLPQAVWPHMVRGSALQRDWQADMPSVQAAQRSLQVTQGVTASRYDGTAQGSCREVFGACPPNGVPAISGKTGTADALTAERSPDLKEGAQLPSRLFGGVFSAQGRRLAVAVMTTRVRDASGVSLEHAPSAAAEAALTLARELGVQP